MKRGRPQKEEEARRDTRVTACLTAEEGEQVKRAAERSQRKLSEWARLALLKASEGTKR